MSRYPNPNQSEGTPMDHVVTSAAPPSTTGALETPDISRIFVVGDTVALRGIRGFPLGPVMVVERVLGEHPTARIHTVWFANNNELQREEFFASLLVKTL